MAETTMQYIGARYVPLVIGEWDSTVEYEPLSIVTYQGSSYTSRRYTPAGTPITNNEYWALTGEYNAQVAQYRTEVQALASRFDDVEGDATEALEQAQWAHQTAQNASDAAGRAGQAAEANALAIAATNEIVNRLNSIYVTPEQYGAVGDNTHDDTQAFADMFADIPDYTTIVLSEKTYRITAPLTINKAHILITAPMKGEYRPCMRFYGDDYTDCLTVTDSGFGMQNIILRGDLTSSSTNEKRMLVLNGDSTAVDGNIDATLLYCGFYYMTNGVVIKGRNVNMVGCLFSQCYGTAGTRGAVVEVPIQLATARRGIMVSDCRFHGCNICVRAQLTNYSEIHTLQIQNCYCDYCNIMYLGISDGVVIQNNRFTQSNGSTNVITLTGTLQAYAGCSIHGNTFLARGDMGSAGAFRTALTISGTAMGRILFCDNIAVTSFDSGNLVSFENNTSAQGNVYMIVCNNYFESESNGTGVYFQPNNSVKAWFGILANNAVKMPNGTAYSTIPNTLTNSNNVSL